MTSPTSPPIDTNETRGMPAPHSFERDTRPRSRSPHRRKSPSRNRSTSPYSSTRRRDRRRSRSRSRSRSRRNSREFDRRRDVRPRDRAGSRGSKSSRGSGRSRSRSPRRRDSPRSRDRRRSRSRSYERPPHGYYGHTSHPHDRPYDRPESHYGRGPPIPNPPPPSRRRRRDTPPGVSLLVRNLANEVTTQDLHAAFARIGELRDVYIPLDYHSKLPKGFAFIEYANPEQARNAKAEMDKFVMKGRELEVVFAQEKRKTPGEMIHRGDSPPRGSDRGMYGGGGRSGGGGSFDRSSSFERYRQREGRR